MTRLTRRLIISLTAVSAVALGAFPMAALASTAPGLGTATSFAILAGTTVTNTGNSVVTGNLGLSPGSAVTGFSAVVLHGTQHTADALAVTAKHDLTTAYGVAASSPCNFNETGKNLGTQTLTPGTYCQTTAPTLTGTLTLSGNGVFIFQIGSTLVTGPGATVSLTNGAQACQVFWQVSSSATLDTTTTFVGTIMALANISLKNGASIEGRALAQTGAVTLINNRITAPIECGDTTVAGSTATATTTTPVVPVLANSGGGPQSGLPWMLVLLIGLGAVTLGLIVRTRRGTV
jgi:Ice-binding-like